MSDPISDEDLQALFARQRAADCEQAPAFLAMSAQARVTQLPAPQATAPVWHWAWSGAAALGLALAAVLSLYRPTKAPTISRDALAHELDEIDVALRKSIAAQHELTAWQSPTDFLLHPNHNENIP